MDIAHLDLGSLTYEQLANLKAQALDAADMDTYRRLYQAQFAVARREADDRRQAAIGR
jgi:hypothetical protein